MPRSRCSPTLQISKLHRKITNRRNDFLHKLSLRLVQEYQVICIEADGNYSNLHLANGNDYLLSFQLGQVESIIKEQLSYTNHSFVRVGKSLIINMDELICVNITKQTLEMNQPSGEKLLFNASREALKKLKNGMVRSINMRPAHLKGSGMLKGHKQTMIDDNDIRVICNI